MHRLFGWAAALTLGACVFTSNAVASVVMHGTRVIVSSGAKEKTVQFSNASKHPFLVQAWVSRTPGARDEADIPYVLTPPIFKINPNSGQTVRMHALPVQASRDVEDVYYLNFSQLPATNGDSADKNRLVLQMRSSVKIFVRPPALMDGASNIAKKLKYSIADNALVVENPTPFHVSIAAISIASQGVEHPVDVSSAMISPKSSQNWSLNSNFKRTQDLTVKISIINDYGAVIQEAIALHHE